ncbi:MAG: hypothetical protein AAF235_09735, partial [Planctomycetota bacterium]
QFTPATASEQQLAYRNTLASFVSDEHDRITTDAGAASRKLLHRDRDAALSYLSEKLGTTPTLPGDSAEATLLLGCGGCRVPQTDAAGHMQFSVQPESGGEPVVVSVFIAAGEQMLGLEPGLTYEIQTPELARSYCKLYAWTDGTLTYLLVSDCPKNAEACSITLLKAMDLPEPSRSL